MSSNAPSSTPRSTTINWIHFLQTIVEGYEQQRSITYGVQKDAIQNGWDAKLTKKGKGFNFLFELIEGPNHTYLSMTDHGTTGLTGRVLKPDEMFEDLPEEEKWGRFESLAFSKKEDKNVTPLGSRGRGKFIFVGASKTRRILYDSLRKDGTYRSGWRTVELTDSLIDAYDEDDGRDTLRQLTDDTFSPLNEIGTRVIIEDPIDEILESIRSGEFEWMIGETWWEIIKKHNAKITVSCDGITRQVGMPVGFDLPTKSQGAIKVWVKGPIKAKFGKKVVTVKKLHMVCESGAKTREKIRGIAIQRGGMKICTITPDVLPERIAYSLYGYVCLNRSGESIIRNAEGLEHNTLSFNRSFMRDLRVWLRSEMKEFAKKELGYSVDVRKEKREKQRSAERKALNELNRIAKRLDLLNIGPQARVFGNGGGPNPKSVRIRLIAPRFPNPPSRRVNYGQSFRGLTVEATNELDIDIPVRIRCIVRFGDRVVLELLKQDIQLKKQTSLNCSKPINIKVEKKVFDQAGEYTISANIVSLAQGPTKGDELDKKSIVFYVEYDPPVKGLFEAYEPFEGLSKDNIHLFGTEDRGPAGGIVLRYNVEHPAYITVQEDSNDRIAEYLFRFGAIVLCKHDLASGSPKLFPSNAHADPQDIIDNFSRALGKLMYLYYMGTG